ncbi:Uncharacterised protein [Mycobacteroides abscessus subsp. abscessus]|nr:Uncharacterised protein [Mycobacteroides abscessus subsp. abscessus]
MTSHSSRCSTSGRRRLTVPRAVPIATTSVPSGSSRPTAGTSVWRRSDAGMAPASDRPVSKRGSAGRSTTSMRCATPSSVTTATCERAVDGNCRRQPSDAARGPGSRGSPPSTRARAPEEDRTTTHGSSGICRSRPLPERDTDGRAASAASSAAAAPTGVPVEASSSVRRGVPRRSETSRSSFFTRARSSSGSSRISRSDAIFASSSSRSVSSSMRENFVRRRRRSSRM